METERFLSWYKHHISNELDVWLYKSWRISNEEVAEKIVAQYNREVDGCRIVHPEINPILLLITIRNTFEVFIHKIKDKKAKECVIAAFNNNLMCRTAIDTEITLIPIRVNQSTQHKPTEEQRLQALRGMANTGKDKMIQGIADYEINKYNRDNNTRRQIEMPPLEINRSEHKVVNLFWDTLESILPK